MTPGEALGARIYAYVKAAVEPELVEPVTKATVEAIATLMSDPGFTAELRIVNDLRQENQWLKAQNVQLQRILAAASATISPPRKRSSTSKKASPKRAPSSRPSTRSPGGTASRSARANFAKGMRQAKRGK